MAGFIWAKIGVKAIGRVFALVPKALTYPVKKPSASTGEMKHDAIVSLKEAVGIDVPKEEKEYDLPIGTTEASKYLGIQITKQGKGKVIFLASRTLTGDIPYLSTDRLDRIKKDLPNVTIFKEENKIVIEVDVEKIINGIKGDPKNKGKSPKEIRNLIIKGIEEKLDYNLKGLGKITGGEFKDYEDERWIYGIAKELYKKHDNQKQHSSEVAGSTGKERSSGEFLNSWQSKVDKQSYEKIKRSSVMRNIMNEVKIEERYHSLTVPGDMYHLQPEVIAARKANGIRFSSKEPLINYEAILRGHNIQLKDEVLTLEDASSEAAISSPSTPNHNQNRRGPRI